MGEGVRIPGIFGALKGSYRLCITVSVLPIQDPPRSRRALHRCWAGRQTRGTCIADLLCDPLWTKGGTLELPRSCVGLFKSAEVEVRFLLTAASSVSLHAHPVLNIGCSAIRFTGDDFAVLFVVYLFVCEIECCMPWCSEFFQKTLFQMVPRNGDDMRRYGDTFQ